MSAGRRLPIAFVVVAAAMLFLLAAIWAIGGRLLRTGGGVASPLRTTEGELPVLGDVPEFALTSAGGEPFGLADLRGRPWIVDFIFTRCAGLCPRMSGEMARLQDELPDESSIGLLSITVDPANDTPEVLREYGARYGAQAERWTFLSGDPEGIYRLSADGFRLAAGESVDGESATADGPFFHSSRMVLVDDRARIRGYYDAVDPEEMDRLRGDLGRMGR